MTSANRLASKVEDFEDNLKDGLDDALGQGMRFTQTKTADNVRDNNSIGAGTLRGDGLVNAIEFQNRADTTFVNASKTVLTSARTLIDTPYAKYVEYGTGSFQQSTPDGRKFKSPDPVPPYGKIRAWIIAKGIRAQNIAFRSANLVQDVEFTTTRGKDEIIYAEQAQLAWAIQNKIGAFGNKPHPFARPAARVGFDVTSKRAKREMKAAVRRF